MIPSLSRALAIAALALALPSAYRPTLAQSSAAPAAAAGTQSYDSLFSPDPSMAAIGAAGDPLSVRDLELAALLASGVAPEATAGYVARIDGYLAELPSFMAQAADPSARADGLLAFLHRRLLRGYRSDATTIDGILDTGSYNCVSSAVLYLIAARSQGLNVEGVQTSDHAFCVVHLPERDVDVETTNPEGFDPGTKRTFTDSFGRVTGFAYVPPGAYGRRKTIGAKALIGLIISNRVVLAEAKGDYIASLRLGVNYLALERDDATRSFLLDRVNNLAAALAERRDYADIERLAAAARAAVGEDPRLVELAQQAGEAGLYETVGRLPFAEALAAANRALAAGSVSRAAWEQIADFVYWNEASRIANAGDLLGAAALAEQGASVAPGDGRLGAAARTFRDNFVVQSHNAFAQLYNGRQFAQARDSIRAALAKLPGNATLEHDLELANAALGR